ncbi:EAL domain-containing protein [Dactylosporangium sp. NPDC005572]|uniref:EAL domain-containing protein n=1 Tax=Dactylosporangium sp. NPDC005572 TaxID=3156889 RepID=UPI0033AD33D9
MASAPVTLAAAGAVLLGGPFAGLGAATAVVLAAVAAALHGCWMFRLAAEARRDGWPGRVTGGIVALGVGLIGAAGCATAPYASTTAAVAVLAYAGPAAGAALVGGLLLLPGVTGGGVGGAALRGLDGVCVALWKYLTLLVLVLELDGEPSAAVFVTCLLAVVGVTVAVVSGVRAPHPRWAAVTAAGGVALLMLGLAVLALLPARRDTWLLAAGGLLVAGSVLLWAGACRSLSTARRETAPAVADGTLIGDPLLVAPVLAGGAAVLYALFSRGRIGTEAMVIGAVAVLAVVLREMLEAATVHRFSEGHEPETSPQRTTHSGLALVGGGPGETVRRAGRSGRIEWHDEAAYVRRAVLEQHLPQAAGRGELDLAFHPVYDLVEGHPVGVEALLRWRHPRLGTIPPRETLGIARELGVTAAVHEWVLHRACRQLSLWQQEGYRLWMSVNVGCDDFVAPGFAERLSLALDSRQVEPADLVVELAERELGTDPGRLAEPLATVRAIGVRTALDGFGTGATTSGDLRRLPADLLKVDRSLFTVPAGSGGGIAPIIDVVAQLGQRLDVTVVAHGLEAEEHVHLVRAAGCRLGQGHYYGTPAPAERVEAALVRRRTW